MSRARHRRIDDAIRATRIRVVGITVCAALAAGALVASDMSQAGRAAQVTRASEANASSLQATSLPPATPAEGHSPRLMRELSGPLTKTGVHRSGAGVAMSTSTRKVAGARKATAPRQATAAAANTLLNGIDVASFQHPNGAAINWTQVAGSDQFAAIKATEGTHVTTGGFNGYYANPYYIGDAQAATAAGMYVSAYHFANPFNSGGAAQADLAAQYAGKAQNTNGLNYQVGGKYLPLMLDVEYNPYTPTDGNECYNLTPAQMVSWISSFMTEAAKDTGAAPIIYTPPAWWATCTGNSTAFGNDVLWVPAFSVNTPGTLPAGWNTWNFWQYSSSGTVPGITGSVDLDYFSGGPQSELTAVNTPASVQIRTLTALAGQQVTYTASGLPTGMTMSSAGLISGTPTVAGTYQVTVTASSSSTVLPGAVSFTWNVDQPPAITSAGQATLHAGVAASFSVTATGFPAPTFAETGALPAGTTFSSAGVLSGTPTASAVGIYPIQVTATNSIGTATQALTLTVEGDTSFVAAGPVRLLDTRNGTGHSGAVGANSTITLTLPTADVPSGATAVVLNVTAVGPTTPSYVTVYPDGVARPTASNLNFTAGETISNLVTVPVGPGGKVAFYNATGSVNLVADLAGYYTTGSGSLFTAAGPTRVLDTRNGTGHSGAVGANSTISLTLPTADVPAGATAVVLNVTATGPTASSFVTVFPDGNARPTASNLNFTAGQTIPNLVVVPVIDGKVDFYNFAGSVNLVADLAGYYTSGTGSSFVATGPTRMLDTRDGTGGSTTPVGAGGVISLQVTGVDGIPSTGVTAVVLNVTATGPSASSYVTVYPDGTARPTASNLNFTAGETIPNLVVVPVGADGMVDFYNFTGSVNLVADLAGYYTTS